MNHRILPIGLLVALLFSACASPAAVPTATVTATVTSGEEAEVRNVVENFGRRLRTVSLLAPDAAQQIQTRYAGLVSATLTETWMKDVSKAPGRMVSSPWPDRIEISTLAREAEGKYVIDGFIVEITSTEVGSGGAADKIPVHMVVEREQGNWVITEYSEER